MEQHKVRSYLLYAIGEVLLVVVGILLALQVNNWNEERKEGTWKEQFLQDLKAELIQDEQELLTVLNWQITKEKALRQVLYYFEIKDYSNIPLIDSLYTMAISSNRTFFPTTGVYESAKSSGNIELLEDKELAYRITNLYEHHYFRLGYNGELYDNSADKVDWEQRLYYDKSRERLRNSEAVKKLDFQANTEYLHDQNQTYIRLAQNVLNQLRLTLNSIPS